MAYTLHNFESGQILEAQQLNEMDLQIQSNETSLENKANTSDLSQFYTKEEIDGKNFLTSHQSLADYYTKTEIDELLAALESRLNGGQTE